MKRRALGLFLAVLATLGAREAAAFELSGWLGGRGSRLDSSTPQASSSELRLRFDAGLVASGYLIAPGELDWRGNLTYGQNRATYGDTRREDGVLTYRGTASFFEARGSRVSLSLGASREQIDFSESSSLTPGVTGTSLTNVFEIRARTNGEGEHPSFTVAASRSDSTNSGFGREDVTRTATQLDAGVTHGGESLNYQLTYRGRLEESSLEALNYLSQTLGVNAKASVTGTTDLGLTAAHFIRDPDNDAGTNPTYEDTRLGAFSTTTLDGLVARMQYDFGHMLLASPLIPTQERLSHSLSATAESELSREWTLVTIAGVSSSEDRSGVDETSAIGEKLSSRLRWSHSTPSTGFLLEAGGRVGLLQPTAGENEMGWGATAGARVTRTPGRAQYSGSYKADYDENMDAQQGWRLSQVAIADVSSPLGGSGSVRAAVQVDARRAFSALLGDSASRTATLSASLRWRTYELVAQGSLSEGVAGSLDNPLSGDGLFLPVGFETQSRSGTLSLTAAPRRRWTMYAMARYTTISGPEFPSQQELLLLGRIGYRIGEVVLGIEERYTAAGREALDLRTNEIMISLTRHFHL